MLAEYANADGSNGGAGLTTKKSQGYNLTLAYRLTKKAPDTPVPANRLNNSINYFKSQGKFS